MKLYETSNPQGFKDIVFTNKKSVLALSNENSREVVLEVLVVIISQLCSYFSLGKNMTSFQVIETAKDILNHPDARRMTLDDFKLCFQYGRTGKYGKIYDRLDGMIIFEWVQEYFTDRCYWAETNRLEQNQVEQKKYEQPSEEFFTEKVLPFIDSIVKKVEPPATTHEVTPLQKLVSRWADQFDVLHRNIAEMDDKKRFGITATGRGGINVLVIGKEWLIRSEYITFKMDRLTKEYEEFKKEQLALKQQKT